jgi:hypothetical protein
MAFRLVRSVAAGSVLALVACGGQHNDGVEGAADLSAAAQTHPTWDGNGPKATVPFGTDCTPDAECMGAVTVAFQAAAVEAALADALKTQDQNVSAESATYSNVPSDFLRDLTVADAKDVAFQLMFRSDGRDFRNSKGFGTALASSQTLKCSTITASKVAAAVAKFHGVQAILADDQDANAKQAATKFKGAIGDAVAAIVGADASASLFDCTWENNDDSNGGAIVSVDAKSSVVRVLFVFDGG